MAVGCSINPAHKNWSPAAFNQKKEDFMRIVLKLTLVVVVVFIMSAAIVLRLSHTSGAGEHPSLSAQPGLIVHEWGTFTSIAGKDGVALEWRPLNGSSDLPKFIHTVQQTRLGLRHANSKDQMTALVRMETPVI